MIIQLNDTYRIESNERNFILQRQKEVKEGKRTGEIYWIDIGYYPRLDWAITGCLKHGLMTSELKGLQQILDFLSDLGNDILAKVEVILNK